MKKEVKYGIARLVISGISIIGIYIYNIDKCGLENTKGVMLFINHILGVIITGISCALALFIITILAFVIPLLIINYYYPNKKFIWFTKSEFNILERADLIGILCFVTFIISLLMIFYYLFNFNYVFLIL